MWSLDIMPTFQARMQDFLKGGSFFKEGTIFGRIGALFAIKDSFSDRKSPYFQWLSNRSALLGDFLEISGNFI